MLSKIQNKFGLLDQIIDGKSNADGFDILDTTSFDRVFDNVDDVAEEEEDREPAVKRQCV